jgi:hypothetical protein
MIAATVRVLSAVAIALAGSSPAAAHAGDVAQASSPAPRLTLQRLVDPASRVEIQGRAIRFALHALIPFETLEDLFSYIDTEAGRWQFDSPAARRAFAESLLRRGVELERAVAGVSTRDAPLVFRGKHWQLTSDVYRDAFLRVRDRWSKSLNCWSASSSIPGRVLSNWYIIDEGIELYGATYDSTEHFWQAVKYHPDVTVGEVRALVADLMAIEWRPWLEALTADQSFYLANRYAVEFLKNNLTRERLEWFDAELAKRASAGERARAAQQRIDRGPGDPVRFTSFDEKVLWGDVADVFHLVVSFTAGTSAPSFPARAALRKALVAQRFDAVYLAGYAGGRIGFLSREFQELMLEIWKVKFLKIPRLNEVIRSTAGVRLDHFLNDGDSPDIPIPVYVGYLNRIREMAMEARP